MAFVRLQRDGLLIVDNDIVVYSDTIDNAELDFGAPITRPAVRDPKLPPFDTREFIVGKGAFHRGRTREFIASRDPNYEAVLAAIDTMLAAQAVRNTRAETPAEEKVRLARERIAADRPAATLADVLDVLGF